MGDQALSLEDGTVTIQVSVQGFNDLAMSNESMTRAWDHPVRLGKSGLEYWTAKVLEWDRTHPGEVQAQAQAQVTQANGADQ